MWRAIGKRGGGRYPRRMTPRTLLIASLAIALPLPVLAQPGPDAIVTMRDAALTDTIALDFVRDITTEVGPRQGGTEAEARARQWAVDRLRSMGFANVRIETFTMPTWVRGEERASVLSPYPQALAITALGNSGATPADGMEGEVAGFRSLAEFEAAPDSAIRGKIVYIGHAMRRTQDGSSYGAFGPVRFSGPNRAAQRGAAAIVIRSVGTDSHRNPHTGNTNFAQGVTPIPAGAISNPDADNLERMLDRTAVRGGPVRMRLLLTPRNLGPQPSGNVIADVIGSDPAAGIVVAACHLDSWDLGTGAIDDAAGCGIIVAAAKRVAASGRPRRTIRLLLAGAEEVGVWGGRAYGEAHASDNHAAALESDFGAGRVWRVDFKLPDGASAVRDRIAAGLAPLGIARGSAVAGGGADIGPLAESGVPLIDLQQDGSDYFDLHHTPDDTFDKIIPADLAQNVAAWTVTLAELANAAEPLAAMPQ